MASVAIITARGGSKRIPKKNIKDFCGKPIIAYSIEAALKSNLFETVMVSTDSEEIAEIARAYGAEVPFMRSEETSSDYATTNDVINEVLKRYREQGKHFDVICCIYPTAPFVTSDDLIKAHNALDSDPSIDSVIPIVKYSFPPQRALVVRNGLVAFRFPENALKRSQDLEPYYHDCGQFYLCRTESFEKHSGLMGPHSVSIEMPEERVQDIDNPSDWALAEMKYRLMCN